MKLTHKQKDVVLGFLIGAVLVLLCGFIYVCLELKQSRDNERSLSQRIDVLMKEKIELQNIENTPGRSDHIERKEKASKP